MVSGVEDPNFFATFMEAIGELQPAVTGSADLWMNDEFQLYFTSAAGAFTFSKDVWGFAFIEADNNQEGLQKIDTLLSSSKRFERLDVNLDDYK
jgi:hypothetical protein